MIPLGIVAQWVFITPAVSIRRFLRTINDLLTGINNLKEELMKSPIDLLEAFLKDLRTLSLHTKGLDRDFHTIKERVKNEGDSFLSVALPTISDALTNGLESGRFSCPRHFSKCRGKAIPKFLSGMLSEVFDADTGLLLDNPCQECIQNVYVLTRMFKKLSVTQSVQRKLDKEAFDNYLKIEEHVVKQRSSRCPADVSLLLQVARCVLYELNLFDAHTILGKHGPGSVYEKLSPNEKWDSVYSADRKSVV